MEASKVEGVEEEIPPDAFPQLIVKQPGKLILCAVCAKNGGDLEGVGGDFGRWFGRFLREVLELDKEETRLKRRSLEVIESLPICGGCGGVIKVVMEMKEGVKQVEERVRLLQREVEEEKRKLERRLEDFWGEMRRMEEIVIGAEGNLEEIKEKLEGGDKRDEQLENPMVAAKILRDSIRFVAQDLQEKGNGKGTTRRKSKRLKRRGRKRYFGGDNGGEILENVLMPLTDSVKVESQVGGEGTGSGLVDGSGSVDIGILTEIKEEPVEIEEAVMPMPTSSSELIECQEVPPIFPDDDDFEPEVISEQIMVTDKFMGHNSSAAGARIKRKYKTGGGDDKMEDDFDNLSNTGSLQDHMEDVDTSDTDFYLDEDDELVGSESESSSSSSSSNDHTDNDDQDQDDGENYGRKNKKKRKEKLSKEKDKPEDTSKKGRKSQYTKVMSTINFHKMSKLKRKLIQRIIHKKFRRPTRKPKTPGKAEVADPRLLHFMEYNSLNDTLSLEGVPIYIRELKDEDNQDEIIILECGECGWRAKPAHNSRHPVDSFMYNHVAGQHLNLFQCVQCGSNLGGFKQYSDHVLGHRMGFACDVCGRPLGGAQALARHKWSHLNEEEAGELVRKGLKDPREKKESGKCWTCENCGKIFPQRCQLRKHEKVHLEVRERITCEICGKLFLPSGFISHKRYYCFPEGVEQPRISCPVCPKVFKNKQFMQVHMDRAHNEERRHKCGKCGKGFKTKKDLMTHEETHTTERAFVCKKGCGRTYKTRKNCNAHEKRCDGRGGILIQRFLDAGDDRPFSCRKGCGRAYKTRRTLRGHEKTCHGTSLTGDVVIGGGGSSLGAVVGGDAVTVAGGNAVVVTPMTVLGAALQASLDVGGGGNGGGGSGSSGVIVVDGGGGEGLQHGGDINEVVINAVNVTIVDTVPIAVATETVVTRNDY